MNKKEIKLVFTQIMKLLFQSMKAKQLKLHIVDLANHN